VTETLDVDRSESIATITVNRPDKRNALDVPTRESLRSALESIERADDVRVVVFRGAGDAFISGGDIENFLEFDGLEALEYKSRHAQGLNNEIAALGKPTIAAIDGYALGAGMEIALACDFRVATSDAKLGFPEVNIGMFPGGGGTQRLVQYVGLGTAKKLIYTGEIINAAAASDLGLVNDVYDPDQFEAGVADLAGDLASRPPIAIRLAKRSIHRGLNQEAGLDYELLAGSMLFETADQKEGARAFLEDRAPDFRGE